MPVCHDWAGAGAVVGRDALPASVLPCECGGLATGLVGAAAHMQHSHCPRFSSGRSVARRRPPPLRASHKRYTVRALLAQTLFSAKRRYWGLGELFGRSALLTKRAYLGGVGRTRGGPGRDPGGTRAGPGQDPGGTRAGPGPTRELDRLQTAPEGDPVRCWCGPQPLPHVESGSPVLCAPRTGHGTGCWTVPKCLFAAAKECGPAHQGTLRWRGRVPHDPCGAEKGTLCTPHLPCLRPRRRTRAAQSQGLCSQRPAQPPGEPRGCRTAPGAAPMGGTVPLSSGFHMGSGERATPGQLVGNSPTLK